MHTTTTQILRQRTENDELRLFLKCDLQGILHEQKNHRLEIQDKDCNVKYNIPLPNRFWAILFWQEFDYHLDHYSRKEHDDVIDCVISVANILDKLCDSDPPHILHRMSLVL